jgi:hypothetical protein
MEWIDVKEQEPDKDGKKILATRYNYAFDCWETAVVKWDGEVFKVIPTRDYRLNLIPEFWMPIPETEELKTQTQ